MTMQLASTDLRSLAFVTLCAAAMALFIASTKRWHGRLTLDFTDGVQKMHTEPTARVGGLALLAGLVMALGYTWKFGASQGASARMLVQLSIAAVPAFLAGTIEDLTKRAGVLQRLLATMASGLLACLLFRTTLTRVDVVWVDQLLRMSWWLSVPVTMFAVGGVANAINIIDGFNGLAGFTSLFAFGGFALLAASYGDHSVMWLSLVMAAAVLGFLVINWPRGKIFLGDGGAYLTGFWLAWIAVLLVERHAQLSAFAVLLILAHPVTEVLFSIFRRKVRHEHPGMPDRLHFHSLVKRRCIDRIFAHWGSTARNSMTGVLVGSSTLMLAIIALLTRSSLTWSVAACAGYVAVYVTLYARIVRFRWCSPINFVFMRPHLAIEG